MKYLSLFSGIGGFELGIEKAYEIFNMGRITSPSSTENGRHQSLFNNSDGDGWRTNPDCIGFSEIDKYATQIYSNHFPNHKNYGDITKIIASELPDFDLLVGGFPCQSFSIAGKRGGFEDTRGTLFFDIARILRDKKPRLCLLENVKGLLSHADGKTFRTIIKTLDELGYDLQWQVLNSKNFGVPQNRERVFIVGHLRGTSRPKVFPFGESNPKTVKRIQADISGKGYNSQQDRTYFPDSLMGCLPSTRTENKVNILVSVLTPDRLNKRQNGRRFKEDGEPSFTLTSQDKHGIYNGMKIRRLTPKECERLQGFPDDWTKWGILPNIKNKVAQSNLRIEEKQVPQEISDTQRYKCLGNAVTVNVIKAIMGKLL